MKYIVTLNGMDYEVEVEESKEAIVTNVAPTRVGASAPAPAQTPAKAPTPAPVQASGSGTAVKAPMPGTILNVQVQNGQAVKEGDVLFILEAMKMENEIVAPVSGTVTQVLAAKGNSVVTDEALAFIG